MAHRFYPSTPQYQHFGQNSNAQNIYGGPVPTMPIEPTGRPLHRLQRQTDIQPLLINHQIIPYNLGSVPDHCQICQAMGDAQPHNIYLRHCIPHCPAVLLPLGVFFATSDYNSPYDIRPCVVYQLGPSYYSAVPGGYHLVRPVLVGFFDPPNHNAIATRITPRYGGRRYSQNSGSVPFRQGNRRYSQNRNLRPAPTQDLNAAPCFPDGTN